MGASTSELSGQEAQARHGLHSRIHLTELPLDAQPCGLKGPLGLQLLFWWVPLMPGFLITFSLSFFSHLPVSKFESTLSLGMHIIIKALLLFRWLVVSNFLLFRGKTETANQRLQLLLPLHHDFSFFFFTSFLFCNPPTTTASQF